MRLYSSLLTHGATIKLTASLPRIFHGNNWQTVQRDDIEEALAAFRSPLNLGLTRLLDRRGVELWPSRVDIALDLYDVPYAPEIVWAVFAADVRFGRPPGFIYRGPDANTYYMKDWRDGKKAGAEYVSALVYGKSHGTNRDRRHIRIEVRFHRKALAYHLGDARRQVPAAEQIARMFPVAHEMIGRMVRHVAPVNDRRAAALLCSLRESHAESIRDLMFFGRAVPLRTFFETFVAEKQERKSILRLMERYGVGVGDPHSPALRLFADVCQTAF